MEVSTEQWLLLLVILITPVIYAGYRVYSYVTKDWEF